MDEIIKSNKSVKEAFIEGNNASVDDLKIVQTKARIKNEMGAKDPHRTTCVDYAFQMVLLGKGTVEVDIFPFRV